MHDFFAVSRILLPAVWKIRLESQQNGKRKNNVRSEKHSLSLVPTCRKNRKNWGFSRFTDAWDSYDQWEHRIPDGQQFLRRDRKNRKHYYVEGPSQTVSNVSDFYDECEHEICLSGTSGTLILSFLSAKA